MKVYVKPNQLMTATHDKNKKYSNDMENHAFMIASKGDIFATEDDDDTLNSFAGDFFNWDNTNNNKGFDSIEDEIEASIFINYNNTDFMVNPWESKTTLSVINKCEYRTYVIKLLLRSFLCHEFVQSAHSYHIELNDQIISEMLVNFHKSTVNEFVEYVVECMSNSDFDFIEERA